jgi:hypothetical protein
MSPDNARKRSPLQQTGSQTSNPSERWNKQLQLCYKMFQTALKNAGFTIDYAGSPGQLVAHKGNTWIFIDNRGSYYDQTIQTKPLP